MSVWAFISLGCISLLLWYLKKVLPFYVALRRLPQPACNPLLGHLADFLKSGKNVSFHKHFIRYYACLFEAFEKQKMVLFWVGWQPLLILFRAESVEAILADPNQVNKAKGYQYLHSWLGTGLITADDKKWKTHRKLVVPAFHFVNLIDYISIFDKQSKILVDKLSDVEYVDDMVALIGNCTLDIICETAMGVLIRPQQRLSDYTDALHLFAEGCIKRFFWPLYWWDPIFRLTSYGKRYYKALDVLHSFSNKVIQERKKCLNASNDFTKGKKQGVLLDRLLQHNIDGGQLTDEEIREEVDNLLFAGHDTSAMTLCWTLYFIGHDAEIQAKIHEEIDSVFGADFNKPIRAEDLSQLRYLECCVKEGLRLLPPVPVIGRRLESDVNILGYKVPKGVNVAVVPLLVHRDARFYPNSEIFNPDRFLPENSVGRPAHAFIPFSAGPRNCIGQKFGMLEAKCVIAQILRYYKIESIGPKRKVPFTVELVVRPKIPLKFRLEKRF